MPAVTMKLAKPVPAAGLVDADCAGRGWTAGPVETRNYTMTDLDTLRAGEEPGRWDARSTLFAPLRHIEIEHDVVVVPPDCLRLRRLGTAEVLSLLERRRRVVLAARASSNQDFYGTRLKALVGHSVIDVRLESPPPCGPAMPKALPGLRTTSQGPTICAPPVVERLRAMAAMGQTAALVAAWAVVGRSQLRKHVPRLAPEGALDVVIAPGWKMRSSHRSRPSSAPLLFSDNMHLHAERLGVWRIAAAAAAEDRRAPQLRRCLFWLAEAAAEPHAASAVVKICTALEAFLTKGREPVRNVLAERSAFLLSTGPDRRVAVSRAVKRLYSVRSDVVHSAGSSGDVTDAWLDAAARLAVAVASVVATNAQGLETHDALVRWSQNAKWGCAGAELDRVIDWRSLGPALARLSARSTS